VKIKEAAQIVKAYDQGLSKMSMRYGGNAATHTLRRIGRLVTAHDADIADDVIAGRGPGTDSNSRRLLRVARKIEGETK